MNKTRKIGFLILIAALSTSLHAVAQGTRTKLLHQALKPLYDDVVAGVAETNIVGRTIDADLDLRFCSETNLLFDDTRITIDKDTCYYFVKWQFGEADIRDFKGRAHIRCHVKAIVQEVRRGATTPGMPYVVARLEAISLADSRKED